MSKSKSPARLLQKRTGWKYQECLRCVRTMAPEAIEMLIRMRATPAPTTPVAAGEEGHEADGLDG